MPDAPASLRAYFLGRKHDSEGYVSPTEWLYDCAFDLLESEPAPAKVRAAAYRMLADLPEIRSVGRTADPLGRQGIAVALGDGAPGGPDTESRLIADPPTGRLLAQETVLIRPGRGMVPGGKGPHMDAPVGTIMNYRALLAAAWTDGAP